MWNDDYKEILQSFRKDGVEFILVGAYALAAHGFPRATLDIDIWVNPTSENALKVYNSLARFGAPLRDATVKDFESDDTIFQIGVAPRRIDILTGISGVSFGEAWDRTVESEINGLVIRVLSLEDLVKNKVASGRTKDLADVEILKRHIETGGQDSP